MKRVLIALVLLVLCAASGGPREFTLFGGANTDSTEQVSVWVPIKDASYVAIRTWTTRAAFALSADSDSMYSDSITVWKTLFSDSVAGAHVTGPDGYRIPVAVDSVTVTSTGYINADSTYKMIGVAWPAIQKPLRAATSASGAFTIVYPIGPGVLTRDNVGHLHAGYMRIKVTPRRRNTFPNGDTLTAGQRVNGLKGLRMKAYVYYN